MSFSVVELRRATKELEALGYVVTGAHFEDGGFRLAVCKAGEVGQNVGESDKASEALDAARAALAARARKASGR